MTTPHEALALAQRYHVTIQVRGDRLHLKAPAPPPPELIEKLREAKPAILRLLARPGPEPERAGWGAADWRGYVEERVALRLGLGHPQPQAARFAWDETLVAWHKAHGVPPPRALCAGCDKPLSGAGSMDIWDGARVHLDDGYRCLIAYGRCWRAAAAEALAAMGIRRSKGEH